MIRPDALLQGLGCVVTGVGTLYGLTFAASETSNPTLTFVLVALALQVPCCLCCGALMVWSGAGGSLPDAIPPALRARGVACLPLYGLREPSTCTSCAGPVCTV